MTSSGVFAAALHMASAAPGGAIAAAAGVTPAGEGDPESSDGRGRAEATGKGHPGNG